MSKLPGAPCLMPWKAEMSAVPCRWGGTAPTWTAVDRRSKMRVVVYC